MPELPEVEAVRRGLARTRLRAPLVEVWRSEKPLRVGAAWREENLEALEGCRPGAVTRRGKYILWRYLGPRDELRGLLVHLGMSGRLGLARAGDPRVAHTHLVLGFADGREVRLVDPRRFGALRVGPIHELHATAPLAELGPEPLGRRFSGAMLEAAAGRSARMLRDVLLDQRVVAGLGNIYVLEALFEAGLCPLVRACRLRPSAWARLGSAIKGVLDRAIENGGTSLRDFRTVTGDVGRNAGELRVYGRAGEPCVRCGSALRGFVLGGRSGAYCPVDQPRPRGRIA